jgi:serine/threonine protein kinase
MSPEQHQGLRADARSDQYSFCIALYEGIFEHPPFVAISDAEMLQAKLGREIIEGDLAVPKKLKALLHRGLEPDPAARFGSMNELLEALEASAKSNTLTIALVATALVAAGAVGYALLT